MNSPLGQTLGKALTFLCDEWCVREHQLGLRHFRIDIATSIAVPSEVKKMIRDFIYWNIPVGDRIDLTYSRKKQC